MKRLESVLQCALCRRHALPGTLACKRHQSRKANVSFHVLPYVVLEIPPKPKTMKGALYSCARCGYQLLTGDQVEEGWSSSPPAGSRGQMSGSILQKWVCKSISDCARRIADQVAGRRRLRICGQSLTV